MKNTGGAAYPRNHVPGMVTTDGSGRQYHTPFIPAQEGMTLRDYFAAAALGGLADVESEAAAKWCYEMADAMLAERDK